MIRVLIVAGTGLEPVTFGLSLVDGLSEAEFFEGFSIPRNKDLIRIFKDLNLVEQLGSGIPRILAAYPKEVVRFSENFLRIVLPSTEQVTEQDTEQVTEQVTDQVNNLITAMVSEHSSVELMALIKLKHRPTFLYNYLKPAIEKGLIELTIPDKPKSSKQKYRLTKKGLSLR